MEQNSNKEENQPQDSKAYSQQYKNKVDEAWTEMKNLANESFGGLMADRRKLILIGIILFVGAVAFLRGFLLSLFQ
ncbi:hypothetical protein [Risungbinella massiliensis]|uniref:hypothetical protein n=1 Tax=Risungbinella massiliensis TaxID=1329796 RepID=UPI0005CBB62E|nr:hypothetical protein [Risungbinella massiliensis]